MTEAQTQTVLWFAVATNLAAAGWSIFNAYRLWMVNGKVQRLLADLLAITERREIGNPWQPGEWQAQTLRRLFDRGYDGFDFGPDVQWWPTKAGLRVAGPFGSTTEFDDWLTDQESQLTDHD